MQTADWALVISILSFAVSLAGFVWNVWSKFIYPKAKIVTTIAVASLMQRAVEERTLVTLSATNYGPTEVTLHAAIAKKRRKSWEFGKLRQISLLQPYDIPTKEQLMAFSQVVFPRRSP